jgi:hypothetical protein
MRPADTSPEAWAVQLALLRAMPSAQKLRNTIELSEMVRQLALEGIRRANPGASERHVSLIMAKRSFGEELFDKVYGAV